MYYFFRNTQISWPIDQSYKSWEKFVHSLSRKTSAYLLEWVTGRVELLQSGRILLWRKRSCKHNFTKLRYIKLYFFSTWLSHYGYSCLLYLCDRPHRSTFHTECQIQHLTPWEFNTFLFINFIFNSAGPVDMTSSSGEQYPTLIIYGVCFIVCLHVAAFVS